MKKLFVLAFLTTLCSCGNTVEINKDKDKKDNEVNYYENDKYVVGKRIFDLNYWCDVVADDLPDKTVTFEEIPGITFYNNGHDCHFDTIKGETIYFNWALYIADVNQDGYFDICYDISLGSGVISHAAYVYDVHNDQLILEKNERNTSDYFFDLDVNNELCLVETKTSGALGYKFKSYCRFLKNSSESMFEPVTDLDFKTIGISLGYSNFNAESSVEKEISGLLYFYQKNGSNCPIRAMDIRVLKVEGPDFIYEIADFDPSNCSFKLKIKFANPGNSKIKVVLDNVAHTVEGIVS